MITRRHCRRWSPIATGLAGAVLAVAVAACGDGGGSSGDAPAPGVAPANAEIGTTPPTSTADGFEIPDVSFTLADGSPFDLGTVDTPVMLIFWAEW